MSEDLRTGMRRERLQSLLYKESCPRLRWLESATSTFL